MADWERAFRTLLATRGGALRSYAYLLTGDPTTAGDLVQEALTRVFSRRRTGDDIDQLEAYVRRAILNQYVDSRRRLKRWNATLHLLIDVPHHDDDRLAVADEVRRGLATLSPRAVTSLTSARTRSSSASSGAGSAADDWRPGVSRWARWCSRRPHWPSVPATDTARQQLSRRQPTSCLESSSPTRTVRAGWRRFSEPP
ncbi:sigma-70 family RNA polymerase sigma factor [Kribbella sindirgiensis]|uniref:Sigma-70 family RNA polymerase sigma factor n=1 Tax=Kribbella sindirgiensis TaxID=1124744 RepID=A0A4R0I0M1_9ACTN|nr:sigma-70 family RNA polymerase sigma factor [Kribbella sindirgiensis]